jgi:hypothetical protein
LIDDYRLVIFDFWWVYGSAACGGVSPSMFKNSQSSLIHQKVIVVRWGVDTPA